MKRFWNLAGLAMTMAVSGGAAWAAGEPLKLGPTRLELPPRIGPLVTDGVAHGFGDPRLGVGYQYNGAGLALTIYVYDGGIPDIPDGGDTIASCQQFEQAKSEIQGAGYANVSLKSQQLVRLLPPEAAPVAREAVLELVRDGHAVISYLWVTGFDGNFIKLRFSLDAALRDEMAEARRAVLDALGGAMKPHLTPVPVASEPGKQEGAGTSIDLSMGSGDDMEAGILYTMLLATAADQGPEMAPVCGGPLVPGFDAEVGIFRAMIAMNGGETESKFSRQLGDAESAGMLEELVWSDLHREEWGKTAPDGLTLREYKSWKKKHLKRFKPPKLGAVVVDHPRPMPLEPAP
jgi:hypothetical protein